MAIQPARILSQRSHLVPGKLEITEHFFEVPLNHSNPSAATLHIFARSAKRHNVPVDLTEVASSVPSLEPAATSVNSHSQSQAQPQTPWLLFLQGGPGCPCPMPQTYAFTSFFLDKGYQMLFLDQRGTGLSSPISSSTLGLRGDDPVQASYLKHFRADSIVRDAESVRLALTQSEKQESKRRWALLGQSFGGFCSVTYLSFFPNSLKEVFLTGGLPPLVDQPDELYKRLFKKLVERNQAYYEKYPEDVERVKMIVRFLKRSMVRAPSGGALTSQRFLQIGLDFGSHGGLDRVHETVLKCWSELQMVGHITPQTLGIVEAMVPWDKFPLYAILQETIYCQGKAANWSAERVLNEKFRGFDPQNTLELKDQPTYFTGETVFPFMFEDTYPDLSKMKGPANLLAAESTWPALYDKKQLAKNTVPVYASVYVDDMFVDFNFALETANAIKGCKTYITNVMYHDAVRAKPEQVLDELWRLRCDTLD